MANEELQQRGYMAGGALKGSTFGSFEHLDIGATRLDALVSAGIGVVLPKVHAFACKVYIAPKIPSALKPDQVYLRRVGAKLLPVAVQEHKKAGEFAGPTGPQRAIKAQEQALVSAAALGANVAIATDGTKTFYIDVGASVASQAVVLFTEMRTYSPAVLDDLLTGNAGVAKDPSALAERVWQLIWHTTKAEPKECLLTFVEMFVLKFLSDNLSASVLPTSLSFYELVGDPSQFRQSKGMTEVEYYVNQIRPKIKSIFPDNTICDDPAVAQLFGMQTIVSKTSVINGFVFLQSGNQTHESYNTTFRQVVEAFHEFGPLTRIDPEFKIRLYETFLRRSARQQRLGQFFTPRNVVRPMIRMAQLSKLAMVQCC